MSSLRKFNFWKFKLFKKFHSHASGATNACGPFQQFKTFSWPDQKLEDLLVSVSKDSKIVISFLEINLKPLGTLHL